MALKKLYRPHELINIEQKTQLGILRKPNACFSCDYKTIGIGFVEDEWNPNAQIALCLEAPGADEALEGRPLVGKAGKYWLKTLLTPLGKSRTDCVICNSLRCRPPENQYPKGKLRKAAELACRIHDDKLKRFNPNLIVITMHPAMLLRSPSFTRLVRKDVEKAFNFADKGYKPLLLMGDKAMNVFAPHLHGIRKFRGHFENFSL